MIVSPIRPLSERLPSILGTEPGTINRSISLAIYYRVIPSRYETIAYRTSIVKIPILQIQRLRSATSKWGALDRIPYEGEHDLKIAWEYSNLCMIFPPLIRSQEPSPSVHICKLFPDTEKYHSPKALSEIT